jgi:predicted methyltransferase
MAGGVMVEGEKIVPSLIVLSRLQVIPLLEARREGSTTAVTSLDLGRTESEVRLEPEGVLFPDGRRLSWAAVEAIREGEPVCFLVRDGAVEKIQFFSEALNRFYSLMATPRAPTMLLSGIPMHRIKEIDPHEDTLRKMRTIAPVTGRVLDTATGLGYTAIAAAKTAVEVVTIELDPTVLEVARRNPWSQELFSRPNIRQLIGDSFEVVPTLEAESFARIFHDPPTFRLAGDLYSGEFYRQLFRVLKRGGRLFHYIGDLESSSGGSVAKGAVKRLQEAGFRRVTRRPEAFGLVGDK